MKHSGHTARNVAIGMALGAVAATVGTALMHTNKRQLKKTAGRAMKTMGNVVGEISTMMR